MFDVARKSQRNKMFNKFSKNTTTIPILTGKKLLDRSKCRLLLKKLPLFLKIPLSRYQRHYLKTIENFAELVQSLPATANKHYSHRGGMLELGLARAFEVIKYHRKQRPGSSKPDKGENLELQRWELTLFTAALFYDLGKLGADFYVTICDAKDKSLGQWNPLNGEMRKFGTHFRYCFTSDNTNLLRRNLTPLLARQIMPKSVFDWIAADKYVLQSWINLLENLSEDGSGSGSGGNKLVLVADAFVINAFNKELHEQQKIKDKADTKRGVEKSIRDVLSESARKQLQDSGKSATGSATDAFIAWLREGIRDGKIHVNGKDGVHIVREGVFLERKIFEKFAKEHAKLGHKGHAIYHQFIKEGRTLHHGEVHYHAHAAHGKTQAHDQHSIHINKVERSLRTGVAVDPTTLYNSLHLPPQHPSFQISAQAAGVHLSSNHSALIAHSERAAARARDPKVKG